MLKFEKKYNVVSCHWAEVEIEDYELDGMTTEEAREYIDSLLWDEATSTINEDIEDTIDDTFTQTEGEPWLEVLARLEEEAEEQE